MMLIVLPSVTQIPPVASILAYLCGYKFYNILWIRVPDRLTMLIKRSKSTSNTMRAIESGIKVGLIILQSLMLYLPILTRFLVNFASYLRNLCLFLAHFSYCAVISAAICQSVSQSSLSIRIMFIGHH